jgi:hypothetical protein
MRGLVLEFKEEPLKQKLLFKAGLWIRIGSGFNDFVDPDPVWESGSRGKKMNKNKYFFS